MTNRKYEYIKGINGHSEIALYVDTFEEVDDTFKNVVKHGATPILEPVLESGGKEPATSLIQKVI